MKVYNPHNEPKLVANDDGMATWLAPYSFRTRPELRNHIFVLEGAYKSALECRIVKELVEAKPVEQPAPAPPAEIAPIVTPVTATPSETIGVKYPEGVTVEKPVFKPEPTRAETPISIDEVKTTQDDTAIVEKPKSLPKAPEMATPVEAKTPQAIRKPKKNRLWG